MLRRFDYEIALELLGQSKQPLVQMRYDEMKKENPNQDLLNFVQKRLNAINELMDELNPEDEYLILRILDKNDDLRKLV
jgi:phosphopantetheine adenylyltransferase